MDQWKLSQNVTETSVLNGDISKNSKQTKSKFYMICALFF